MFCCNNYKRVIVEKIWEMCWKFRVVGFEGIVRKLWVFRIKLNNNGLRMV